MDKTEYVKNMIISKYKSQSKFSKDIGLSLSTINNILNRGIEKSGLYTMATICKALDISLDELTGIAAKKNVFYTTEQEQQIITNMRKLQPKNLDKIIGMIELKLSEQSVTYLDETSNQFCAAESTAKYIKK